MDKDLQEPMEVQPEQDEGDSCSVHAGDGDMEMESSCSSLPAQVVVARSLSNEEYEQLVASVPKDAHGNPTSIGSRTHEEKGCTRCPYLKHAGGCQNGIQCQECHLPHKRLIRNRPPKAQRIRNRLKALQRTDNSEPEQSGGCSLLLPQPSVPETENLVGSVRESGLMAGAEEFEDINTSCGQCRCRIVFECEL